MSEGIEQCHPVELSEISGGVGQSHMKYEYVRFSFYVLMEGIKIGLSERVTGDSGKISVRMEQFKTTFKGNEEMRMCVGWC